MDPPNITDPERARLYGSLWNRLWQRLSLKEPECRLGREPLQSRRSRCSVCLCEVGDFEIDHAVASLIVDGVIKSTVRCPYREFSTALFAGLWMSSEAFRKTRWAESILISQLEIASRHIDRGLNVRGLSRGQIRAQDPLRDEFGVIVPSENDFLKGIDEYSGALADIVRAETLIANAFEVLKKGFGGVKSSRGRPVAHDLQSITRACANTWEELLGKRPGKNNTKFHALLSAAATTIGSRDSEPDWAWTIRAAIKGARRGGGKSTRKR